MPIYSSTISATSHATPSTDDEFIEITAAAASAVRIRAVYIYPEGATAAGSSVQCVWKLVKLSVAGTGGTSGTTNKRSAPMRDSSTTNTVKATTTPFVPGTITATYKLGGFNTFSYDPIVFIARTRDEEIEIAAAAMFGVIIKCATASQVFRVTVDFED